MACGLWPCALQLADAPPPLAQARALFGNVILLSREIATGAVAFLSPDAEGGHPSAAARKICRYMAVFGWTLKARRRRHESIDARDGAMAHEA